MKYRAIGRRICLAVFTFFCAFVVSGLSANDDKRPNIVLIVADDQGYADLSCSKLCDDAKTPHIDRLVANGTRFTQAYATSPICNASRAGLITGCYQQRQGITWYGGPGIHLDRYPTIAEVLAKNGYERGYIGKFHYGGGVHHPGNRSFPTNHGFEYFFGCASGRKHYLIHNAAAENEFLRSKKEHNRKGQSLQKGPMWVNKKKVDTEGFSTELFGDEACKFIEKNRDKEFFLQVAFNAVHNFTHQLPVEYLKQNGLKGYRDWDPAVEEYYDWYRAGRKPNNPEGRAHYLGQLHFLDREVGKILDRLENLKLAENTIIIYVGDNGGSTPIYANNSPLRGSKYTLYEGGIRVPLIITWPARFSQGVTNDNLASALDIMPTICRATGVMPPATLDGIDLGPLLRGDDGKVAHDTLYWFTGHETAIRHGRWKLRSATSKKHADYEMVDLELGDFLYDLDADIGETTNLMSKHPDIARDLKGKLKQWFDSWK